MCAVNLSCQNRYMCKHLGPHVRFRHDDDDAAAAAAAAADDDDDDDDDDLIKAFSSGLLFLPASTSAVTFWNDLSFLF